MGKTKRRIYQENSWLHSFAGGAMKISGEQFLAIAATSVLMQFGYCISYLKYLSNLYC